MQQSQNLPALLCSIIPRRELLHSPLPPLPFASFLSFLSLSHSFSTTHAGERARERGKLRENSPPEAQSLVALFVWLRFPARSHEHALAALGRLVGVLRLLDLADQQLKRAAHVLAVPRARLGPRALVLVGHRLALLGRHLPLLGAQVALVADDADRDAVCALVCGGSWLAGWVEGERGAGGRGHTR